MITIRLKVIRFAQFGSKNNNYTHLKAMKEAKIQRLR